MNAVEEKKERVNVWELTCSDGDQLRQFVSETGKIKSRRFTRLSAMEQRRVAKLIKQSRNLLLLL